MKPHWIFAILVTTVFACTKKERIQISPSENVVLSKSLDTVNSERYFKPDSLLIKRYISDSGNEIELRGSLSKDLYKVVVKTKAGKIYNYEIADNAYIASHSQIIWDNEKYIFVRSGCGTGCWYGRVLSISGNEGERDYLNFVYSDSTRNIIVYPDSLKWKNLIAENLENKNQKNFQFEICKKINIPALAFDSLIKISQKKIQVYYSGNNCNDQLTKIIEIE
jgi:hypothetical protein